ncbi:MAG TPA: glycosyltransferase family 4 protein [Gemmatimonadaceae bacterium]|nr:glycosyltransferase family 4 protein [Gemmatimonadaceae bacterium]
MRVLFLHTAREWSGTARAFARAGRGLAERGAKVTLLVPPDSNVEIGVSARRGAHRPDGAPPEEPYEVIPFSTDGMAYFAARRMRKLFRRWDTDAVFVTTDREHLIAAIACFLARSGSVVRRAPAGVRLEMGLSGRFASRLARTAFLFASESDRRNAVLPAGSLESAVAELGVDAKQYATNGEGRGREEDGPADAAEKQLKYIVCVYDPTSRGRAATAIRTLSMLTPRHPDLRLIVVGAGSDDEDLRMQAAALRILHLVSFLGERDDEVRLMQDAHLGWVVADGDTAAYGLLDLMALAVPVVASEGGIAQRYVAHGISGTLYPPDDSASTAAAVAGLLASEEQRAAMGRAARTRVTREFPEKEMIDGFDRAANIALKRSKRKA